MVKKTPKSVSQEDLEVWKKITIQLKRNKPEVLIKKNISGLKIKKSSKSLPKAPELKPFIIGEKLLKYLYLKYFLFYLNQLSKT